MIKTPDMQIEGLKTGLDLLGQGNSVEIFVLDHEITTDPGLIQETVSTPKGSISIYSDNPVNVERFGDSHTSGEEMAERLKHVDVVIPF